MIKINLDATAAAAVEKAFPEPVEGEGKETKNAIQKTHGVLEGQGPYAAVIYALAQNSKIGKTTRYEFKSEYVPVIAVLYHSLSETGILGKCELPRTPRSLEAERFLDEVRGLSDNLPNLTLAYKVADRALMYARYRVEALGPGNVSGEGGATS